MGKVMKGFVRSSCLIAIVAALAVIANAQFRAGLQGSVTDSGGATVAGATVTLTSKETNQTQKTQTSDAGFYRFTNLAPGLYSISVEQTGFKRRVVNDVKVDAEAIRGEDVVLDAGVISETVTVEADAAALQTEDANVRRTITTEEVLRLPQTGRDPYELARLAPGVFGAGARSSNGNSSLLPNTSGPGGSNNSIFQTENAQPITANGQRVSANNYQIDGVSVNSQTWGGAAVITPSQESVKEVQVTSSTYSAEDGRNSGAQVRVVSQNGTNQWAGSAFFKYNDPNLNAFNQFYGLNGTTPATRVERKFKTYGGSFGGPVVKDKLFFFFSYEGLKENSSNTADILVDTEGFRSRIIAARAGTVTARLLSGSGAAPRISQVLPSGTCADRGLSSTDCQVVAGGFDLGSITGAYGTYNRLDQPRGGGFDGLADLQFARVELPRNFTGNQYFGRVDYQVTVKDKLTYSTYIVPAKAFTSDISAQGRPQADVNSERLNTSSAFVYSRNISSNIVNEVRFNYTRWGFNETETNPGADFGLPRVEIEGIFGDRLRYGFPGSPNTPGVFDEKQFDFRDVLSMVRGNMVMRFGAEYRRDLNGNGEPGGARPLFSFVRPWNFANGTPIFENITADQNGTPATNNTKFTTSELAFFAQNDWKLRPNLTLNLGLRWSRYSPIKAGNGVLGNLIPGPNGGLAGAKISTDEQFYDSDNNNFAPQIGFAYSPSYFKDKMVIRGGGGIGYDRLANALLSNARRNPPNGFRFGLCCGTAAGEFGSPFLGGQIAYVASSDGTISGFPRNPVLGGGTNPTSGLPNNGSIEIYGAPRDLPTAYVYRYSLETQYELPRSIIATLGYQGSAGRKFVRILPLHIVGPSTNPNIGAAYFASPDVNSNYNAMIARVQGRLLRQVQFDVNYRFSKSIDTVSFEGPTGATNQSFPVDQREERGPSDFDVRHALTGSVIWDLPIFKNRNTLAGKLLGGWQINSIFTRHTGFPWTPKAFGCLQGTLVNNFCDPRPLSYTGQQPLDNTNDNFLSPGGIFPNAFIPGADCNVAPGCNRYFNTVIPFNASPFANRPGIGRNVFRGPKYFSLDMTFGKTFGLSDVKALGEAAKLDIRANFFNILNTLNLAPFNSNADSTRVALPTFGRATSALAGRTGELQIRLSF